MNKRHFIDVSRLTERFLEKIRQEETIDPFFTSKIFEIAVWFFEAGWYLDAKKTLSRALRIHTLFLGNDLRLAEYFNKIGEACYFLGNFSEAERYFLQSVEINERVYGRNDLNVATNLSNLSMVYKAKGDYYNAKTRGKEALEIRKSLGDREHIADSLNNLGTIYYHLGEASKAKNLINKSLEIMQEIHGKHDVKIVTYLNNTAYLLAENGKYSQAEKYYNQVLEINRKNFGEKTAINRIVFANLGLLYQKIGDLKKAKHFAEKACLLSGKFSGGPDYITDLIALGEIHTAMGRYARAQSFFKNALSRLQSKIDKQQTKASCLREFAFMYCCWKKPQRAMRLLQEASRIEDSTIKKIFSMSTESERLNYLQKFNRSFEIFIAAVFLYFPKNKKMISLAFDMAIKRHGIVAETMVGQRAIISNNPTLNEELGRLNDLKTHLGELILHSKGGILEQSSASFEELNQKIESLEVELARSIPQIEIDRILDHADHKKLAQTLTANSSLIEFLQINLIDFKRSKRQKKSSHYIAFVINNSRRRFSLIDLGDAKMINNLIFSLRRQTTSKNVTHKSMHMTGSLLRRKIFDPLLSSLGDDKRLFIVPDGLLTLIPFETLPLDNGTYLIDDYEISYLSTSRDLFRNQINSTTMSSKSVIMANPDYDLSDETKPIEATTSSRRSRDFTFAVQFKRLEGTEDEGIKIAELLMVKPWIGKDALEGRLKATKSPLILHIATHGFFLSDQDLSNKITIYENPLLRSGLALAGANKTDQQYLLPKEAEDGILTAVDVAELDLSGTELTVLSACETGLGQIRVGEGVFGLRRAFVLSGAKTLVMSMWQIPDEQTKDLMIEFYSQLKTGKQRHIALRNAMLKIKETNPHPYFWGSFVCQGKIDPITTIQNI